MDLRALTGLSSRPSKSGERLLALVWTYARCLISRPQSRAAPGDHLPALVADLLELTDFPQPAYEQSQVISFLALVADLHALTDLPSRPAGRAG